MLKKFFTALSAAIMMVFMFATPVSTIFAEDIPTDTVTNVQGSGTSNSTMSVKKTSGGMPASGSLTAGDVGFEEGLTTEKLGERLTSKGFEIVDVIRNVAMVICLGAFVISVILAIFGGISKKATVMPGIIGMIISIVAFVLIFYAPQILIWGKNFLME